MNDPITYRIIGAAQKVHRALGPGFGERTYHVALCREFTLQQIPFSSEFEYQVFYEDCLCGVYRCDLVVRDEVIVELKATGSLAMEHRLQTLSYLKASGLPRALLLNFGAASLEVRRFANVRKRAGKTPLPFETESPESDNPAPVQPNAESNNPSLPVPNNVSNPLNPINPALPVPD